VSLLCIVRRLLQQWCVFSFVKFEIKGTKKKVQIDVAASTAQNEPKAEVSMKLLAQL